MPASSDISASPHRASYDRFVGEVLEDLLRQAVPAPGGGSAHGIQVSYAGVERPPPAKAEEERCLRWHETYARTLFLLLDIAEAKKGSTRHKLRLGKFPRMTARETFIVQGIERVPIAQLRLEAGVYFEVVEHPQTYDLAWTASIRPRRGAHIRFEVERPQGDDEPVRARVCLYGQHRLDLKAFLKPMGLWETAQSFLSNDPLWTQYRRTDQGQEGETGQEQEDILQRKIQEDALRGHLFNRDEGYDLSQTGRDRLNRRLKPVADEIGLTLGEDLWLKPEDLVIVLAYLFRMAGDDQGTYHSDDLNDLSSRRVWLCGDHLEEVFYDALAAPRLPGRGEIHSLRAVVEEELNWKKDAGSFVAVLNSRAAALFESAVHAYFQGSFCQALNQTNPLSEVSHKRTVTFLGPGGIQSRKGSLGRRNVHPTHYGRLCLLETPESDAIGLNLHLAAYARVNNDGQVEAPFLKEAGGSRCWLTSKQEAGKRIRGAYCERDDGLARCDRDVQPVSASGVTHADAYPAQALGLAASLIPFADHDDLNRGMMGAKNMKQALPLISPERPLIKTGLEVAVARLSGWGVEAGGPGTVTAVSDSEICIGKEKYSLQGHAPTSAGTCFWHRPVVEKDQKVKQGQIVADGAGMKDGELALGVNLLVAYLPWKGYNFEDGIVLSDRLVRKGALTSWHVYEISEEIRGDERVGLGSEESDRAPSRYYEKDHQFEGIIRRGRRVKQGDPILRKWKVRHGVPYGRPVNVRLREDIRGAVIRVDRQRRIGAPDEDPRRVREVIRIWIRARRPVQVGDKLMGRHGNKGVVTRIEPEEHMPRLKDGRRVDVLLNPTAWSPA